MDFKLLQFLIPVVFFWYAYKLYVKKPAFGDERGGFPTRRARENEEIWAFVQCTAGIVCFVMAVLQTVVACAVTFVFSAVGVKIGSVFGAKYKKKATVVGGAALCLLGLKILLQHLGVINF